MNWMILYDALLGLPVLIATLNLVYMLTRGRHNHQRYMRETEEFIAFLDNCILVCKSDTDEEEKAQMLLYLSEQWREMHPERVQKKER